MGPAIKIEKYFPPERNLVVGLPRGGLPTPIATPVFRAGGAPRAAVPELLPCDLDQELTRIMDGFRRSRDPELFERLAKLAAPRMLDRVRTRARFASGRVDPQEIVQDALVNIYLYPDRFDAAKPGAFRAWSSMILDNALRRWLRKNQGGPRMQSVDWLAEEPDQRAHEPMWAVIEGEQGAEDERTWCLFLALYLRAYGRLQEKERFVLQMVEVHGKSYAELAGELGIRREALKMAVFRARRRLLQRLSETLPPHWEKGAVSGPQLAAGF